MAGVGKYLDPDGKVGTTDRFIVDDEEIREGMAEVLEQLKQNMRVTDAAGIKYINGVPLAWINGLAQIIENGAAKHGAGSYLDKDNPSMQDRANFASKASHAAKSYSGQRLDDDSGLYHELHEACRALMKYERYLEGID